MKYIKENKIKKIYITLNLVPQNHFVGNNPLEINKKFIICPLKLCWLFCFICLLKILNEKATVSKETIGS